jgi:hypothetical protein
MKLISRKNSSIDQLYNIPGVRGLSDDIMDGKALIRKLVAIYHAAVMLPGMQLKYLPSTREAV